MHGNIAVLMLLILERTDHPVGSGLFKLMNGDDFLLMTGQFFLLME